MPVHSAEKPSSPAYPRNWREWCELACTRSVVLRGVKFAVVVGVILIAINHGDAIMSGSLTRTNYLKMGLTVVVPYVVSVFSSVGALAEHGRRPQRDEVTLS